ncbi:hypothetical protein I3842_03G215900 [Carya illinoinensis]|uniref:CRM domain-containing protein n=1 Tax=Carya illinoinensis TaxID=32201 RepID=A0A922FNH2_CARIL|nr:hypothetical protein I3842_03G215900 [Carya illinoinensis]
MALKWPIPCPIFTPPPLPLNPNSNPSQHRPSTEVRFSRWNNANAQKFEERRRAQKEIEDDIRRERRFESATRIADNHETDTATTTETFKSVGTPSFPSAPSIPGKRSKYSKNPNPEPNNVHPAFRRTQKTIKIPNFSQPQSQPRPAARDANITIGPDGVSYVIDGAPFEFKYSYTETPKAKPLRLREPPFVPFGPTTMPRPWTGRAPLPPSKKQLKEFDSFQLPPPNKKGVKPVQSPGPFLAGSGPRPARSREEILGEPLTKEEIADLIKACMKTKRQLNMGRDGLTHNMLDNIHALWKRRRVCKIKCKGVCTVDMDNVHQQLEERTGGKIIYRKGGVVYLFRGRNYNYRTRPQFPLMLWKPVPPVYPRLIRQVPDGLTHEEVTEMRNKGQKLMPICKLAKNGVYCDLVKNVREAFEECELVRIDCQGINGSDYRKIGAKLKDLVPCVLISFAYEHILMWRGRNWKSTLPKLGNDSEEANTSNVDPSLKTLVTSMNLASCVYGGAEGDKDPSPTENGKPSVATYADSNVEMTYRIETEADVTGCSDDGLESRKNNFKSATILDSTGCVDKSKPMSTNSGSDAIWDNKSCTHEGLQITVGSDIKAGTAGNTGSTVEAGMVGFVTHDELLHVSVAAQHPNKPARWSAPCTEGILQLWKQAVDNGSAVILDGSSLDDDVVYQRAVALAQTAAPGPVFRHRPRKLVFQKVEVQETRNLKVMDDTIVSPEGSEKKSSNITRGRDFDGLYQDVVPQGSLRVDELAKLLA